MSLSQLRKLTTIIDNEIHDMIIFINTTRTQESEGNYNENENDLSFFLFPSLLVGAIHSLLVSPDDLKVVTTSIDKMIKFFEILSFDMSHMISTEYIPTAAVWLSSERGLFNRVGVADQNSGAIRVYRADGGQQGILAEIGVHTQPVK